MKIRFSVRREVQDENRGTDKATIFEAGQVYDLPDASASRWLARGVAIAVEDPAAGAGAGSKRKAGKKAAKIDGTQGAGADDSGGAGEGGGDPAQGEAEGSAGGEDPGAGGDPADGNAGDETEAKV
jgi:hypothetical protein